MRKPIFVIAVVGVLIVAVLIWRNRPLAPPEQAVRERIDEAVAAAERKDLKGIMAAVSDRFAGGDMDRRQLKGLLFLHMQRGSWKRIFLTNTEVTVMDPKVVEVELDAVLASGGAANSIAEIAPERAGVFHFQLTWELEDGDEWRITHAKYERRRLDGLLR